MLELPGPPGEGGEQNTNANKQSIQQLPTQIFKEWRNFFFFLGFTQNIKITKIQLSGEEEKKKKKKNCTLQLGRVWDYEGNYNLW